MIISWEQMNDYSDPFGGGLFNLGEDGVVSDITGWRSRIPPISELFDYARVSSIMSESGGSETVGVSKIIGDAAMADWVRSTRQILGELAMTTGIISSALPNVNTIMKARTADLLSALDVVGQVLDSELFEMAMNAIGAIPIVGWIIKIVYEIANAVARVVVAVFRGKDTEAREIARDTLTIPMSSMDFTKSANDAVVQEVFNKIKERDSSYMISPPFSVDSSSDLRDLFAPERVFDDKNMQEFGPSQQGWAAGYLIKGRNPLGLGYIPGSASMTNNIFLKHGSDNTAKVTNGGSLKDMAELTPTAQMAATTWWSNVNKPGPSMFSVNPLSHIGEWSGYIHGMYRLVQDLGKGWGLHPTALEPFTNKYMCFGNKREGYNTTGASNCRLEDSGKKRTIEAGLGGWGFGASLLYGHLGRLFFNREKPFHNPPPSNLEGISGSTYKMGSLGLDVPRPDAIDYGQSVPVKALNELYDRQRAALDSLQCMYVDGNNDGGRFPAFHGNTPLRNLWRDAVTNVFSSGAWRRVVYQDIPPGEVKEVFAQYAQQHGITDLEDFNRPCAPGEPLSSCGGTSGGMKILYGGRIPDSPSLPTPNMSGAALDRMPPPRMQRPGGSSSKTGALTAIIAAGALAYIFTQRK